MVTPRRIQQLEGTLQRIQQGKINELESIIARGPKDHSKVHRATCILVLATRTGEYEKAVTEALAVLKETA
jgi:hypothetical protein